MQDLAGCDNNRTPVYFLVPDIYRFVGDMPPLTLKTYARNLRFISNLTYTISCAHANATATAIPNPKKKWFARLESGDLMPSGDRHPNTPSPTEG